MSIVVELRLAWEREIDTLKKLPFKTAEFRAQQDRVSKAWKQYEQACQQAQINYEAAIRVGKAL
jgi:hypothetical protein